MLLSEKVKLDAAVNHVVSSNLFTTITNANFDEAVIVACVKETMALNKNLAAQLSDIQFVRCG